MFKEREFFRQDLLGKVMIKLLCVPKKKKEIKKKYKDSRAKSKPRHTGCVL